MTVQLQQVTKAFRNGRGVFDIDFTLQPGRITALVGANGAGKSTIIKLLTGLLTADAGTIVRPSADVRYMPDDIDFPDTLTAAEIIQLLASLKGVAREEQETLFARVGLDEAKRLKVGQYSKGMRQRLNLAQSLMGDSTLFILDEPTNGLDPYWIAQLKKLLEEQRTQQQAILFSTHLLSLAEEIADEVVLLHDGRIIATGVIAELLTAHRCPTLEALWLKLTGKELL